MSQLFIDATIIGKKFTAFDPNAEWTCIGYCCNETFLLVGTSFDAPNNRSTIKTFKLSEVKFKGELVPVLK